MNKLIFTFLLFPYLLSAQISSHIYYQSDSTISCEIIQLDSVKDTHLKIVYYHENGSKSSEFFDRYGVVYDTLNSWDELGNLSYQEFHSDTGYTEVNYFDNGNVSSIGYWKRVENTSYDITVIDSSTFDVYESVNSYKKLFRKIRSLEILLP